ncbi:hypothetical protein GQ600_15363 [Phytophthora cactorum]|nr:hypothetical protein GQ600_15363 [Phytophthora cactorum]
MCFLTGNFHQSGIQHHYEELAEQHTEIRDRILGRGRRASRSVARLLNGLIPTCVHPKPEDTLDRIHGPSGNDKASQRPSCLYFVDGNRRIPLVFAALSAIDLATTLIIDHDSHAKILAAIANEPSLARFYLQLSQPQATKRLAPALEHQQTQRRRLKPVGPPDVVSDATVGRSTHSLLLERSASPQHDFRT